MLQIPPAVQDTMVACYYENMTLSSSCHSTETKSRQPSTSGRLSSHRTLHYCSPISRY